MAGRTVIPGPAEGTAPEPINPYTLPARMTDGALQSSKPGRAAVRARVVRGLDAAVAGMLHQRAGVAAGLGVRNPKLLDVMAHPGEPFHDRRVEAALHLQGRRGLAPGAPEEPAWGVDGIADVDAGEIAGEDLGLELRLPVAPHCAVGHHPTVSHPRERRNEGMEGLAPRLERIDGAGVERKGGAPVLPMDAGARQDAA